MGYLLLILCGKRSLPPTCKQEKQQQQQEKERVRRVRSRERRKKTESLAAGPHTTSFSCHRPPKPSTQPLQVHLSDPYQLTSPMCGLAGVSEGMADSNKKK